MVLFMVGALCFSLALVPVSITRSTHPDPVSSVHFGLKKLFEISPGAVIACIGSGLIGGAYFGMGVIYARQVGLDLAEISLFMGALMVSGLLLQWPIGRLSDHIDRRWVISGTCFNAALFALAMAWLPPSNWWLFLGVTGMFGGLAACIYPLAIAHANDFIEPHDLVPASSGMVLCYGLGAVLGPVCGAAAMELFGPGGLFLFIAINCFGVVGFTWYRSTRRTLLPTVEKDPYVLLPDVVAMPVAIDVDPRAMEHFEPEDVGPPTEEALIEAGVIDEPRPVAQNA
jgi:MFS family permease